MTTAALLERYRPALAGHCYRMLGSVVDAVDGVQHWTATSAAIGSVR